MNTASKSQNTKNKIFMKEHCFGEKWSSHDFLLYVYLKVLHVKSNKHKNKT